MSSDSEAYFIDDNDEYEELSEFDEIEMNLRKNNEELLNETLNRDSDSVKRIQSCNDETLLHLSVRFGRIESAKRLIDQHGIDINSRDYHNRTPLFEATKSESVEMFKFLLSNGADINITQKKGPNFLQAALLWSPMNTVELVVQKLHVDFKNEGDFQAADDLEKCQKIVKFLLTQKIDLMFPDSKFSLLLFFVLKFGDEETFKLVLQKDNDFDINALSPNESPILHHAIRSQKVPQVNLLLNYGANIHVNGYNQQTTLHCAAAANNSQLLHYLLQHGVDVNAATKDNKFTPLHYAVSVGNKEIVESLLNAGADLKAQFQNGMWEESSVLNIVSGCTILNALSSGNIFSKDIDPKVIFDMEMMQFLLERGAETEIQDYSRQGCGLTPLERACEAGRMDVLQLLSKYGANFHRVDKKGSTMLHHAVIGGNVEIIDLLLRMDLNINAKNFRGQPPLYHATDKNVKVDAVPLIEFLVDNGANVDLDSLQGYNLKLPDVVQCLLELNGNFIFTDSLRNWLLDYVLNFPDEVMLNKQLLIAFGATTEIVNNSEYIYHRNRDFVNEFDQECKIEVSRMKNAKFYEAKSISLYGFLANDLMKVTNFTVIENILENLESRDLVREYPHYAFLLEKRIGRVKTILYFKNSIADFLEKYATLKLPIDIVDHIFSYLRIGDIRNFGRALSLTRKESKTGTLQLPGYLNAQCNP